jgi:hypothetical protein
MQLAFRGNIPIDGNHSHKQSASYKKPTQEIAKPMGMANQ